MKTAITNVNIINEGAIIKGTVLINDSFIENIIPGDSIFNNEQYNIINGNNNYILPGLIDDQVHFREPGLTDKAEIYTESRAAVAGGITSYMEMPNTKPPATTIESLEEKYKLAAKKSLANYSFYLGATNDNLEEVKKINPKTICGVKVFMGSSTGNMLVDDRNTLEGIFKESPVIIATHCEDEDTIKKNLQEHIDKYGDDIPINLHPVIRSDEACYKSSSLAVELAKKYNSKLHVLHISSAKEMELFTTDALKDKNITAEVCVHHLWFNDKDYDEKGTLIKWNPAVKTENDQKGIWDAFLSGKIDVLATDHAPHLLSEKQNVYTKAPSGGPLVQHSLMALLDFYHQGKLKLEQIAEKASHNVARLFNIEKRGFIRKGFYADLVLVDLNKPYEVNKSNILYKCGWSPFEGHIFKSSVLNTFVNGKMVYDNGNIIEAEPGMRLSFER